MESKLDLHINITVDGDKVTIEASPASMRILAQQLNFKADFPDSVFITLVGHGPQSINFKVPGAEPDGWGREFMKAFDKGVDKPGG